MMFDTVQELEIRVATARAEAMDPARQALARRRELADPRRSWGERLATFAASARTRAEAVKAAGRPRAAVRAV